jgi:hypothetical protein
LVDNYKNPNRNMINLRVHKAFRLSRRRNSDCKSIHPNVPCRSNNGGSDFQVVNLHLNKCKA